MMRRCGSLAVAALWIGAGRRLVAIEDVGAWIRGLSDPDVISDLEAGADWLATENDACRGRRVGITGVCMGGLFTLLAACLSDRFAAAAPFYGMLSYVEGMLAIDGEGDRARKPVSPIEAAGRLQTPTLASFGREDGFIPESDDDDEEDGEKAEEVLDEFREFIDKVNPEDFGG